jgi:hypothetical protein
MKKIFLTSGLVLCMICPAFAVTNGIFDGSPANECNATDLGGVDGSDNNDTAALEAVWEPVVSCAIVLDSNRYATSSDVSASSSATTAASVTPVFSKYGVGIYPSISDAESGTNVITSLTTSPAMTGYTFAGFYTGKAGTGTQVIDASGNYLSAANTQVTVAHDENCSTPAATWYAHWTPNTISLTWYPDNTDDPTDTIDTTQGSEDEAAGTCTYGGSITLPTQPEKTGFTFVGWSVVQETQSEP